MFLATFALSWFDCTVILMLLIFAHAPQYGMTICENTEPVGVECRLATTQGAIPSGVVCDLTGLQCIAGRNIPANETCPDMEIRYRCARSRGESRFLCMCVCVHVCVCVCVFCQVLRLQNVCVLPGPSSAELSRKIMTCLFLGCKPIILKVMNKVACSTGLTQMLHPALCTNSTPF